MKIYISENSESFCKNGSIEHFQKNAFTKTEEKAKQRPVIYNYTRQAAVFSAEKIVAVLIAAASVGIAGIAVIKNKSVKEELKKTTGKLLEKDKKLKEAEEKYRQKITNVSKTECSQKIKKENNSNLSDNKCKTGSYTELEKIIEQKSKTISQTSSLNIKKPKNRYDIERGFIAYIENLVTGCIDKFCSFIRSL